MSTHAGGGSHNDAPRVLGAAVLNVGRLLEHACRHRADCPVRAAYSQVKLSASSLAARATVICALGSPRSSFFLHHGCLFEVGPPSRYTKKILPAWKQAGAHATWHPSFDSRSDIEVNNADIDRKAVDAEIIYCKMNPSSLNPCALVSEDLVEYFGRDMIIAIRAMEDHEDDEDKVDGYTMDIGATMGEIGLGHNLSEKTGAMSNRHMNRATKCVISLTVYQHQNGAFVSQQHNLVGGNKFSRINKRNLFYLDNIVFSTEELNMQKGVFIMDNLGLKCWVVRKMQRSAS
jgi:hypothetical protein